MIKNYKSLILYNDKVNKMSLGTDGEDANTIIEPGTYFGNFTNVPLGGEYGYLRVSALNSGYIYQEFFSVNSTSFISRYKNNWGAWTDWNKIVRSTDIKSDANALGSPSVPSKTVYNCGKLTLPKNSICIVTAGAECLSMNGSVDLALAPNTTDASAGRSEVTHAYANNSKIQPLIVDIVVTGVNSTKEFYLNIYHSDTTARTFYPYWQYVAFPRNLF